MTQEKAPRMEAGAGKGGPVKEASHHTVQPNRHPVDGRAARKARNLPDLASLYHDRATAAREVTRLSEVLYGGSAMTDTPRMLDVLDRLRDARAEVRRIDRLIEAKS